MHRKLFTFTIVFSAAGLGPLACADVLTWVGAGTNGNEAIEHRDPGTLWSRSENWLGEIAEDTIPTLHPDGSGTDAIVSLGNFGRIYASALQTRTLTIDNSAADFNWDGNLVLQSAETHVVGNSLELTGGAVLRQAGGRVEFVDRNSSISLQDGSIYRLDDGETVLPGTLTLGSGDTKLYVNGGHLIADKIVLSNEEADICVSNGGSVRVHSLVLETLRPNSCIRGRLEVQHISARGGNLTAGSNERVGLVAPTDVTANRETAILQIDGDITFWGGVEWQIYGTEPGLGYDQIDANGNLTISGILDFEFPPLTDQHDPIYLPKTGDTFDVVVADNFVLTEVGLRLPSTSRGLLFTGHWGSIGSRQGLRLIAQYDFRQALGDFNGDQRLDIDDLSLITRRRGNMSDDSIYDLDQNGLVDDTDRRIWIHQLKQTRFGDSNLDGEFNSGDLTAVFQAAKYDLDEAAGWAEGDWTGDGRFDSSDLTAAFQDGGYQMPQATDNTVPEPSSAILIAFGIIRLCRRHTYR